MDLSEMFLESLFTALGPFVPWIVAFLAIKVVLSFPLPGRGPNSRRRDPWRSFKWEPRNTVMNRAGGRCESAELFVWGRCSSTATEVDHVFPHSKGGPTVVSNGQALCAHHNRRKRNSTPPWWYVLALEKRRRAYFPPGMDVRVIAVTSQAEADARARWEAKRR